jgi:pimeloyl-ACP methyl ester carboxylesterase
MERFERTDMTTYKYARVGGRKIFYREAGSKGAPIIVLLHGFPTSSHMFRDLIPLLAGRFHLVAPDFPGFGQSDMPEREAYDYTFANIANTMSGFIENIEAKKFAIYIFDYGSPVGLRVALQMPDRISAIISQNGNAYEEGLSSGWDPIRAYWRDASQKNRDALRVFLNPETTVFQYTHGAPTQV